MEGKQDSSCRQLASRPQQLLCSGQRRRCQACLSGCGPRTQARRLGFMFVTWIGPGSSPAGRETFGALTCHCMIARPETRLSGHRSRLSTREKRNQEPSSGRRRFQVCSGPSKPHAHEHKHASGHRDPITGHQTPSTHTHTPRHTHTLSHAHAHKQIVRWHLRSTDTHAQAHIYIWCQNNKKQTLLRSTPSWKSRYRFHVCFPTPSLCVSKMLGGQKGRNLFCVLEHFRKMSLTSHFLQRSMALEEKGFWVRESSEVVS